MATTGAMSILSSIGSSIGTQEAWAQAATPAVPAGSASTSAPGSAAPAAAPPQPGIGSMLLPFGLMFGVVYFLMIRPQQKRLKEQQTMLSQLKYGDEVVTASGMLGRVAGLADKVVTVEVADNVKIKFMKHQIAQVVKGSVKDLSP